MYIIQTIENCKLRFRYTQKILLLSSILLLVKHHFCSLHQVASSIKHPTKKSDIEKVFWSFRKLLFSNRIITKVIYSSYLSKETINKSNLHHNFNATLSNNTCICKLNSQGWSWSSWLTWVPSYRRIGNTLDLSGSNMTCCFATRRTEEGNQVVCNQSHHLCMMFHCSYEKPTEVWDMPGSHPWDERLHPAWHQWRGYQGNIKKYGANNTKPVSNCDAT